MTRRRPIILVRHASTAWSGQRYCGRSDPPLDAAGRAAADAARERPRGDAADRDADRLESAGRARADGRGDRARPPAARADRSSTRAGARPTSVRPRGGPSTSWSCSSPELAARLAAGDTDIDWPGGETAAALDDRVREAWAALLADRGPSRHRLARRSAATRPRRSAPAAHRRPWRSRRPAGRATDRSRRPVAGPGRTGRRRVPCYPPPVTRRRSSAPGRDRPDRRRSFLVLAALLALVVSRLRRGDRVPVARARTDGSDATADATSSPSADATADATDGPTETPADTAEPTEAATDEPTRRAVDRALPVRRRRGRACTGTAENRTSSPRSPRRSTGPSTARSCRPAGSSSPAVPARRRRLAGDRLPRSGRGPHRPARRRLLLEPDDCVPDGHGRRDRGRSATATAPSSRSAAELGDRRRRRLQPQLAPRRDRAGRGRSSGRSPPPSVRRRGLISAERGLREGRDRVHRPLGIAAALPNLTAVAPNPRTGPLAATIRTAATAVSSDSPPGSGIVSAQPPDASSASRSKAMYQPSIRAATVAAQPRSAACPPGRPSIPAPKWATGAGREHPRLRLVEDLAAERARHRPRGPSARRTAATRSGSPRPQAIANGIPQTLPDGVVSGVLKSPWASNQTRPSRRPGRARRRPAIAPAWEVQSPPSTSRRASGCLGAADARPRRGRRAAAGSRRCAARFFARGSGSGAQPGSLAASPASCQLVPASPGRAASRPGSPSRAELGRRALHAGEVAAQGGRRPDDDDGPCHAGRIRDRAAHDAAHAHRRLRPGALLRPLGVRRRAPPVRLRRPGRADGRPPGPGRRRDPRAVGRPDPRLHRVDRPSAPASRDRRPLRRPRRRRRARLRRRRGGDLLPRQRPARARATTSS